MIDRYSLPEMAELFGDVRRMRNWLEVELLAAEAWGEIGVAPQEEVAAARRAAPVVDEAFVSEVERREAATGHDVAAFVDVVQQRIGAPGAAWIHYGLTSSDVVDTALGSTLKAAGRLLVEASSELVAVLVRRAREFRATPMLGRTHGMAAEPITFGSKLGLWAMQAHRAKERLEAATRAVSVGKLSGAVGNYSNVDPRVERFVCERLGLEPVFANQVVSRDRHAEYLWAIASAGATLESFATEIRHLQRSEVAEVQEPFGEQAKGSSAMPHKRNPVVCERICGLARLMRGYLQAGLEDVALWHERDISHSSVERVALPDASLVCYYALKKMSWVLDGLVVRPERMVANLEAALGLVHSQPVLLALVAAGYERDHAYRIVQRAAHRAEEMGKPFRSVLEEDPEVKLDSAQLDEAFDLQRRLKNSQLIIDALEDLEVTK
jgi:adenylosuccinate lyase